MKLNDEVPVTMNLRSWIALAGMLIGAVWFVAAEKIKYDTKITILEDRLENVRNWYYSDKYPDDPWSIEYRKSHPRFGT